MTSVSPRLCVMLTVLIAQENNVYVTESSSFWNYLLTTKWSSEPVIIGDWVRGLVVTCLFRGV